MGDRVFEGDALEAQFLGYRIHGIRVDSFSRSIRLMHVTHIREEPKCIVHRKKPSLKQERRPTGRLRQYVRSGVLWRKISPVDDDLSPMA